MAEVICLSSDEDDPPATEAANSASVGGSQTHQTSDSLKGNDLFAKIGGIEIYLADLGRLREDTYFSDSLVDAYLSHFIAGKFESICVCNSLLYGQKLHKYLTPLLLTEMYSKSSKDSPSQIHGDSSSSSSSSSKCTEKNSKHQQMEEDDEDDGEHESVDSQEVMDSFHTVIDDFQQVIDATLASSSSSSSSSQPSRVSAAQKRHLSEAQASDSPADKSSSHKAGLDDNDDHQSSKSTMREKRMKFWNELRKLEAMQDTLISMDQRCKLDGSVSAVNQRMQESRIGRFTRKLDLFNSQCIFVPIVYDNHWSLVIVDLDEGRPFIHHMDSLRSAHQSKLIFSVIRQWLRDEQTWRLHSKEDCSEKEQRWKHFCFDKDHIRGSSRKANQQANASDCGLYVCYFAHQYCKDHCRSVTAMDSSDAFDGFDEDDDDDESDEETIPNRIRDRMKQLLIDQRAQQGLKPEVHDFHAVVETLNRLGLTKEQQGPDLDDELDWDHDYDDEDEEEEEEDYLFMPGGQHMSDVDSEDINVPLLEPREGSHQSGDHFH